MDWEGFMAGLAGVVRYRVEGPLPSRPGWFDPAQLEQVLINLIKNAHESGSPPDFVTVTVTEPPSGQRIVVADRGAGMSDTVPASALLPFYSTKRTGTGLGLPLCREVAEAHGGRLSPGNRDGGGLEVIIWLPPRRAPAGETMG